MGLRALEQGPHLGDRPSQRCGRRRSAVTVVFDKKETGQTIFLDLQATVCVGCKARKMRGLNEGVPASYASFGHNCSCQEKGTTK